ncbi:group III truncated hemoglobin [Edaphobacter bradus]|uniref:group III truncated hemoglobin n=1 Tax=Edaphobacter bradus TaxID=2259016 RepID=UPI0021E01ACF|nr:group III truncated hemoglobin [Edaphobacter bradus]
MESKITESEISNLVDTFYTKVRLDPDIGPIFNAIIDDWPHHLALLKDFWSTVLLTTGRYKGDPMMKHLQLPLDPPHFERWLALFAETANEVLPPTHAANVVDKSHRIAKNFKAGIAHRVSTSKTLHQIGRDGAKNEMDV